MKMKVGSEMHSCVPLSSSKEAQRRSPKLHRGLDSILLAAANLHHIIFALLQSIFMQGKASVLDLAGYGEE
ncbi:hypothetical protein J1N35_032064, partial [Gossypium stocksii]